MRSPFVALLVVVCIVFCASCAYADSERTIVTSFYPLYIFTANLTRDIEGVALTNLAAPEVGCLHDYQLTTKDMKLLGEADVFIVNGAGMESFLTQIAGQFEGMTQIVATDGIPLKVDGNAHVWLSGEGAMAMVENIASGLIAAMPEHEQAITKNAADYLARLKSLDETLSVGLAPLNGYKIITFHEAFPYFAQAYGIEVAAVIDREPGEALNAHELAELATKIKALNTPPLFIEPQYPDIAARTLSTETGAAVFMLDPVVTGPLGPQALTYYEMTMLANMQTLLTAFAQ